MRYAHLMKTLQDKRALLSHVRTSIKTKEEAINTYNKQLDNFIDQNKALDNLLTACKLILEKITYNSKTKLEQFVTFALQQIFTDKDYQVELEIKEDVKNPALTIMLVDNGIRQEVKDSVGGGIITVLGFLFQIYYLEVYGLNKIMFIDEGLKEVSKVDLENTNVDYLGNLLNFIKTLEQRGYHFVIITHDDSVRLIADKVYRVKNGNVEELKEGIVNE